MKPSDIQQTAAQGRPTRCAAPAGGAQQWGRGCRLFAAFLTLAPCAAFANNDQPIVAPSGLDVFLVEFLEETEANFSILRGRFIAPDLTADSPPIEVVLGDLEFLCNHVAIPHALAAPDLPDQIIVSLSAEPLELGVIAPEIPQFFEAYSLRDNTCIWELF